MLYQALYVLAGQPVLPYEVIYLPELARYVQGWGWGQPGDCGFLASDATTGQPVGAV
jgi:hypothetical protein